MAITNSDALPQVNVTINDGGLRVAPPQLGPKLTLLGVTSNTGITTNEVYVVADLAKAVAALRNSDDTPSELSLAVEEAFAAGARNVEVVKIGLNSEVYATSEATGDYDSDLRYALLAATYDILLNHPVDIVVPLNAWFDDRDLTSGTHFGKQLADFCYQSTKENNSGFGVIAPMSPATRAVRDSGSWSAWATANVDGINFGDSSLTEISAWVTALTDQTATELNAYIDGSDSATYKSAYKTAWTASDGTLGATGTAEDGNGLWIDSGQFISIIAAPNRYVGPEARKLSNAATGSSYNGLNYVNTDGSVAYAAKLTTLDPHIAATNQTIFGQRSSRALSASQAKSLLNNRYVSMFTKPSGYVISSAITGAHNVSISERSDFVRVTTVRITQAVVDAVRDSGEAFIGKPISTPYVNAMESQIESTLSNIARAGAIRSYDFAITASPDQQVLGEVSVSLTIVPAFELTTINATVSLTKGEGIG